MVVDPVATDEVCVWEPVPEVNAKAVVVVALPMVIDLVFVVPIDMAPAVPETTAPESITTAPELPDADPPAPEVMEIAPPALVDAPCWAVKIMPDPTPKPAALGAT